MTEQAERWPQDEMGGGTMPDVETLEVSAADVVARAQQITITTDDENVAAGEYLVDIKTMLGQIAELFDPIDTAQKDARKITIAQRKGLEGPLLAAETIVKRMIGAYDQVQEIAREKAVQEQLEAARKAAEDIAIEEAARLEREGKNEAAEDRLRQPMVPVVAPPPPPVKQAAGVSTRKTWKWRLIAADKIGAEYMKPDDAKIGKVVRAMGSDAEKLVGGIEVYEERGVASGRR